MRTNDSKFQAILKAAVRVGGVLLFTAMVGFGQQTINLTAGPTTLTLPDGLTVPMWGYACGAVVTSATATCAALNPHAPAATTTTPAGWSPIVITVPVNATGATSLTINLTNNLYFQPPTPTGGTAPAANGIPTSLVIVGQVGGGLGVLAQRTTTPSPSHASAQANVSWPIANTGASGVPPVQGSRVQSFGTEVAAVAVGSTTGTTALTWSNLRPGTYLLESGTHPSIQVPMGLYGILVVTAAPSGTTAGTAYPAVGTTIPAVQYNAEIPLEFSEIDPVQNKAVNAAVNTAGFSETLVWSGQPGGCGNPASATFQQCYPPAVNYTPFYFLINGVAFNKTIAGNSLFPVTPATGVTAGTGLVLVRMVNAGSRMHVPAIVGSQITGFTGAGLAATVSGFTLIAEDGNRVPGAPRVQTDVFMAAGKTFDVMINAPTSTTAPAIPVYDRELSLSGNSSERDAGMLAYISVNSALLPSATSFAAAMAMDDYYSAVIACPAAPCTPFTVSDVSKGVIANDTNVYGVQLLTPPTGGTLTCTSLGTGLCANGTFTYTPNVGNTGTADSFVYCANGAVTGTGSAAVCSSGIHATAHLNAATVEAGSGIMMGNASYTAKTATYIKIAPPGVLAYDKDTAGYPLTVAVSTVSLPACSSTPAPPCITIEPNGGFIATSTGPGIVNFTYKAQNSQGTLSSAAATVTLNFPTPNGPTITVLDGKDKTTKITDYRWIIEEDETFYINPNCTTNTGIGLPTPGCPALVSGGTVPTFGVNFHTAAMPFVAQGCTGTLSCESGQKVFNPATGTHVAAACDAGSGVCDITRTQETPVDPSQVVLDVNRRYYISVLPGDAANTFNAGYTGAPNCAATPNSTCGHGMGGAPIVASCLPLGTCTSTSSFSPVTVLSQPNPYPPSRLSVVVFEDDFPLNGEQDSGGGGGNTVAPIEPGLGNFEIILLDDAGLSGDVTGQLTHDFFNMPLSNALAGQIDPSTGFDACPISTQVTADALAPGGGAQKGITGRIVTCPKFESDGATLSPLAGQAVVANMMPGRYSVQAIPGADRIARGEEWLQTNTLDGQHPHDSFLRIGEPSYFQEFGPAGYHVSIGFANPAIINDRAAAVCAGAFGTVGTCTNTVKGRVVGIRLSRTPDERLYPSGSRDSFSWTQCWVSLGDPDAEDFMFTKCDANGNFQFTGVPGGEWRLTIGDQWNDQIIDGLSTAANVGTAGTGTVEPLCPGTGSSATVCNMGDIGVQQWQSNVYTRTFIDDNKDGLFESTELGIPFLNTTVRYRDGSLGNNLLTDFTGAANFNETFPLFNWYAVEADTTRYKTTGIHTVYDAGGPADGTAFCGPANGNAPCGPSTLSNGAVSPYDFLTNTYERTPLPSDLSVPGAVYCPSADCTGQNIATPVLSTTTNHSTGRIDPPWVAAEGWQGFTGQGNWIEFAKAPYAPATATTIAENGGIHGHVVYAATRPFDNPTMLVQVQWEPLVPNVTMNLYKEDFAIDPATGKPGSTPTLTLVDTTQTSSWDAWAQGFYPNSNAGTGANKPYMSCPGQLTGTSTTTQPLFDLFYFTLFNQPDYLDTYNNQHNGTTLHTLPYNSQYKCYDGMHNWNQVQPAFYDGMYAFPSVIGIDPNTGKPVTPTGVNAGVGVFGTPSFVAANLPGTNCTICVPNPTHATVATGLTAETDPGYDPYRAGLPMLPHGKYVVEVVLPPGYELVKEEDKNILIGDNFIAPVTQEFAGFGADIFILPDQASVASLYDPSGSGYNANSAQGPGLSIQNPTTSLGASPAAGPVPGFLEPLWPCVGELRVVPDYMSIFPQSKEVAPFAGASRHLCDRKEVTLGNQMSATAKFYIYTSTHITSHFTGVITDDFTSEFDPFAPAFGEKFAPPNLPISVRDWTGAETSRVYSDHFGLFDGITYSTWEVNPPNPTGYAPTMMVTCMNDKGPVLDTNPASPTFNQQITDPLYNPVYSQFCYELPFMPGETDYMDTPVVPTAAFAGGYNFPDCQYPDATPAIKEVDGTGMGPWVSAAGATLTITALGDVTSATGTTTNPGMSVTNAGYSGPSATVAPFNAKTVTRHFGFGSQCTSPTATNPTCNTQSSVTIGGVSATITGWSDTQITVTVPGPTSSCTTPSATCNPTPVPACAVQQQAQYGGSTAQCGQLVITAGNGKRSVDTVTVTIGGKAPTLVSALAPPGIIPATGVGAIQSAIDKATPGDLLIVGPGTYTEMVIMWKPVRLQGVGAASVVINANTQPAGRLLDPWRRHINCLFGLTLLGVPQEPVGNPQHLPPMAYDPSGQFSCPDAGWTNFTAGVNNPQIDRLPLEAVVAWDATLNGNLAELLQEPSLMGAYEGAGITVLGKGLDFHGAFPWNDGSESGAFPAVTTLLTGIGPDASALPTGDSNPLCKDGTLGANRFPSNFMCNPSSIDALSVHNSSQGGGGIFVHGWAHNLQIANNRVYNNTGTLSGGVSVGQGEFAPPYVQGGATNAAPGSCSNGTGFVTNQHLPMCLQLNANVHNNSITQNSSIGDELFSATLAGGGGVTFCTGNDYYKFNYNWVCGNLSSGEGGGAVHLGEIFNGDIEHNSFLFNQSSNPTIPTNGGGLMVQGTPDTDPVCGTVPDQDCPPGLSDGTGPGLVINANLIQGNSADSGSGGGLRLQSIDGTEVPTFPNPVAGLVAGADCATQYTSSGAFNCLWNVISVTDNIIVNNVAGWDGAGVSVQDALVVNMVNNTIAHNDSTATSGVLNNTLGAALSSAPGGNCVAGGGTTSCPQPAGLVSVANTSLLTTPISAVPAPGVICPPGHAGCKGFSNPILFGDVFWQNRAFDIGVGGLGTGTQNQQKIVTLFNGGTTTTPGSQTSTGQCNDPSPTYWDIGVRGDASATPNSGSGFTLHPVYSFLTSASAYGGANNSGSDPAVIAQYCNGSRIPPECTVAFGCVSGAGWAVPPGISDAVVPNPVFSLTPAATVDEGNNWIHLAWGPLSLTNPALTTGPTGDYGSGPPLGNYSLTPASPAIAYIPCSNPNANGQGCTVNAVDGLPTLNLPFTDFFGNRRPDPGTPGQPKHVDVGAVELQITR
jgi:hypothetical protein